MKLKESVFYRIPFRSKGVAWCGIFMGFSLFLRYLYYFIPCDFAAWNAGVWIFKIILPTLLCGGFGVLLKLVRLRAPGVYGILAAALCLLLLVLDMMDGNLAQIILAVLTLPVLGFLLLATYGGYIPFRSISALWLVFVILLRLLFGIGSASVWLTRLSEISILAGLLSFTVSLKPHEKE